MLHHFLFNTMPLLIAHRPLVGDYGHVAAGQEFLCASDEVAEALQAAGLASLSVPIRAYNHKMITPSEQPVIKAAEQPQFAARMTKDKRK